MKVFNQYELERYTDTGDDTITTTMTMKAINKLKENKSLKF